MIKNEFDQHARTKDARDYDDQQIPSKCHGGDEDHQMEQKNNFEHHSDDPQTGYEEYTNGLVQGLEDEKISIF